MNVISVIVLVLSAAALAFGFWASYCISSGIYLKAVCRFDTEKKIIALTFDDGPCAKYTPGILDLLGQYGIEAAFFCIGSKIEGNEHILKRMADHGHLIGIHSYRHDWRFTLSGKRRITEDLTTCADKIKSATGFEPTLFRPPFGVTNPDIASAVKKLNLRTIGWSIRSFDTVKTPGKVIKRVTKRLKPGSIILLHDNRENTVHILQAIIKFAMENGYKFARSHKYIDLNNFQ